jgi:lipid-A-disaccharide synthase
MALIFPFEVPLYGRAGIPCTFVGNPLLDRYRAPNPPGFRKRASGWVVGLLPGSRKTEVSRLLETLLQSALILKERVTGVRFLVSSAPSLAPDPIRDTVARYNGTGCFTLVRGDVRQVFDQADLLIAASGTVTLEAALCGIPMVIVYRMAPLSYLLARLFVRVRHAGLANIIAGRTVVPELLQDRANPESIAATAASLLDPVSLERMQTELLSVRNLLGTPGASVRTARLALALAQRPHRGPG